MKSQSYIRSNSSKGGKDDCAKQSIRLGSWQWSMEAMGLPNIMARSWCANQNCSTTLGSRNTNCWFLRHKRVACPSRLHQGLPNIKHLPLRLIMITVLDCDRAWGQCRPRHEDNLQSKKIACVLVADRSSFKGVTEKVLLKTKHIGKRRVYWFCFSTG